MKNGAEDFAQGLGHEFKEGGKESLDSIENSAKEIAQDPSGALAEAIQAIEEDVESGEIPPDIP